MYRGSGLLLAYDTRLLESGARSEQSAMIGAVDGFKTHLCTTAGEGGAREWEA